MGKLKEVKGHIVLIQEERFRLASSEGSSFLFDLAHGAPISMRDLAEWARAKQELVVEYEGEPELESGVARDIRVAF